MKRIEMLRPLSREHHAGLLLAQSLKRNAPKYKNYPGTEEGKINFAVKFFNSDLVFHFGKEGSFFASLKKLDPLFETLINEILDEHIKLRELFLEMKNSTIHLDIMNEVGLSLESHIRKEERILFPKIETTFSEMELARLNDCFINYKQFQTIL